MSCFDELLLCLRSLGFSNVNYGPNYSQTFCILFYNWNLCRNEFKTCLTPIRNNYWHDWRNDKLSSLWNSIVCCSQINQTNNLKKKGNYCISCFNTLRSINTLWKSSRMHLFFFLTSNCFNEPSFLRPWILFSWPLIFT